MNAFADKISYVLVDTQVYELSLVALRHSQRLFPLNNILIYSDEPARWGEFADRVIPIPKIASMRDYTKTLFLELPKNLSTDFALVIQWDGFVLNPDRFSNIFLEYDYIGASWSWFDHFRVGNGGFSLRSKKLVHAASALYPLVQGDEAEDLFLCRKMRVDLEGNFGVHFAPEPIADHFSTEYKNSRFASFGFHGVHNLPQIYAANSGVLLEYMPISALTKYAKLLDENIRKHAPEALQIFQSRLSQMNNQH